MKHLKRAYLFILLLFLYLPIAILIALSFNGSAVIEKHFMTEGAKKAKQVTQWNCYTDANGNLYSFRSENTFYVDDSGTVYDIKHVKFGGSSDDSDLETDDEEEAYVILEDGSYLYLNVQKLVYYADSNGTALRIVFENNEVNAEKACVLTSEGLAIQLTATDEICYADNNGHVYTFTRIDQYYIDSKGTRYTTDQVTAGLAAASLPQTATIQVTDKIAVTAKDDGTYEDRSGNVYEANAVKSELDKKNKETFYTEVARSVPVTLSTAEVYTNEAGKEYELSHKETKRWTRAKWNGFSFEWFGELFRNKKIMDALWVTVSIAVLATIVSVAIGTFAAIGIHAMQRRPQAVMMTMTNLPNTMPDIVTGISLMLLFTFASIDKGYMTMLLAHISFDIPYVILSVMPKLKQMNRHTYEAALDLGATPFYALNHVIIPVCRQGIVTGALLAFTLSLDDFTISYFTSSPQKQNLSTLIYSATKLGIKPTYYALSALMFIVMLVLLLLVNKRSNVLKG